jgi:hypothetical protein
VFQVVYYDKDAINAAVKEAGLAPDMADTFAQAEEETYRRVADYNSLGTAVAAAVKLLHLDTDFFGTIHIHHMALVKRGDAEPAWETFALWEVIADSDAADFNVDDPQYTYDLGLGPDDEIVLTTNEIV